MCAWFFHIESFKLNRTYVTKQKKVMLFWMIYSKFQQVLDGNIFLFPCSASGSKN